MKKKKIMILLLLCIFVIPMTGCTKYLSNQEKKPVTNEVTGQRLVSNILCQPEDEVTRKLYEENGVDLSLYPKCSAFQITSGGYEGIWTTIFVKPLAWFILQIGKFAKNYGFAVIIVTLLIRLLLFPLTQKTAAQSENMKAAKPELDKLEKKYRTRNDQDSMMQKSQEMLGIYKKYKISPFAGCIFAIIQIPLFFAFYEALNRLPAIFEEKLLGFQLGTSPMTAIFTRGEWQYLLIIILVIATTYFSFKLNKTVAMDSAQEKQMKFMTNISVVMISIASLTISVGIALYWIFNSGFTIIQNLFVKWRKEHVKSA